jgi:hypothetical protein
VRNALPLPAEPSALRPFPLVIFPNVVRRSKFKPVAPRKIPRAIFLLLFPFDFRVYKRSGCLRECVSLFCDFFHVARGLELLGFRVLRTSGPPFGGLSEQPGSAETHFFAFWANKWSGVEGEQLFVLATKI